MNDSEKSEHRQGLVRCPVRQRERERAKANKVFRLGVETWGCLADYRQMDDRYM